MGARRPKPTALKERTKVRPQLGLSRLFAAANSLVPFHQYDEESEKAKPDVVRDLKLVPEDDKTLALDDPRLQPQAKAQAQPAPLFNPIRQLDPFPQFDPEAFKRSVDPGKDSVLPDDPQAKHQDEVSNYGTAIRVPNRRRHELPETQVGTPVGTRTSITKLKRDETKRKREFSAKAVSLFFLVPAIGLATYGLFANDTLTGQKTPARASALTPQEIQERLNYYRTTTGGKLNRERIDVQIQNFKNAPALGATDHKVKPPSIMDGLPLQGESRAKNVKDLPYDPTYSESKIAYGLQEEQERVRFEKLAREAWISEFVTNARKDGVDVQIDEYGNVTYHELKSKQQPLFDQ